jgi:hypothetical protein
MTTIFAVFLCSTVGVAPCWQLPPVYPDQVACTRATVELEAAYHYRSHPGGLSLSCRKKAWEDVSK